MPNHQENPQILEPGTEVTIWPIVGPGYSRDTEEGLQPWTATYVGMSRRGKMVVSEPGYEPREIDPAAVVPS